jgi:anaerobic sulfite reductase subunit C
MKWTKEAQQAVAKVPFFVRKRVRKRVEEEAAHLGVETVRLEHVRACQKRFLEKMEDEVRGYRVETCFGPGGCPHRVLDDRGLVEKIEDRIAKRDLKGFLKERVEGPLKLHHEFRVSIADCPNACSRPQIVDLGLIGAGKPEVVPENPCSRCWACVETCREAAVGVESDGPVIHEAECLGCGQCMAVCPTGSLRAARRGYRVLVGGKLGRHPRLGRELSGIHSADEVLTLLECCLDHYQSHCRSGERFGEILDRTGFVPGFNAGEKNEQD